MQPEINVGNRESSNVAEANDLGYAGQASSANRPAVEGQPVAAPVATSTPAASSPAAEPSDAALQLAADLRNFQKVAAELVTNLKPAEQFDERCNQAFSLANDLFGHAPTWVCFFREVLAVGSLTRRLFPSVEEYSQFMTTSHYDQIQQMLTALRSRDLPENDPNDPQRMITVRLPKSLHEALVDEAGSLNISVNKLCISRLLQVLDQKMVPETLSKPRGRKPRSRSNDIEVSRTTITQ